MKAAALFLAVLMLAASFAACKKKDSGKQDLPVITSDPYALATFTAEATQELQTFAPENTDEAAETEVPGPTPAPTNTPKPTPTPTPKPTECPVREDGQYNSKDEVALYIHLYGHLPSNFITKKDANALGWTGGSLEPYAPGCSIGGDYFGNYEGLLPKRRAGLITSAISIPRARTRGDRSA